MPKEILRIPEYWIQLNKELKNHPKLMEELSSYQMHEVSEKLTHICTYAGILLDGYYLEEQIEQITEEAIKRLKKMSALIVVDTPTKLIH